MDTLFQLISDLHEEFSGTTIKQLVNPDADIVILGGDITHGVGLAELAFQAAKSNPDIEFIVIAGNHEFYPQGFDYLDYLSCLPLWNQLSNNLHFLENTSVVIDKYDLEIFGGIGWTNLSGLNDVNTLSLQIRLNDFKYITVNNQTLTPTKMRELNAEFRSSCIEAMSNSSKKNKLVVSHFPQAFELKHLGYPVDLLTCYFCSDDNELIRELARNGVTVMVSGHTHDNFDRIVEGVRQISNQVGYPHEDGFENNLLNSRKLHKLLKT
ncbi:metallophosphoesterase [Vibrio cyclitrophicus]|uniref:metallophosphoesterase n=1 Tax=Vibrio cyclitrophicus TaxID=47951 RepID=UPI000C8528D9|nr:metallophosphoesterase [Vibrio cyclitrophicus]